MNYITKSNAFITSLFNLFSTYNIASKVLHSFPVFRGWDCFSSVLFKFCFYVITIALTGDSYSSYIEQKDKVRGLSALVLILSVLLVLGVVAFYTLLERKGIAAVQRREGPNVTGPFGLLQPLIDGGKLILKEVSSSSDTIEDTFFIAPLISFSISCLCWNFIPTTCDFGSLINSDYSLLWFLAISSLSIYGTFFAGWSSGSKYALIGSIRAIAQFITYEVYFSITLLPIIFIAQSTDLVQILWRQANTSFLIPLFPFFIIFCITMLVETNRAPFDMPEAEAELVAGFNVEYSSISFALFFLGEYNSMVIASTIIAALFCGSPLTESNPFYFYFIGWPLFWMIFKILIFCFLFVFIRANFPRVRFDQLLWLGWKVCLPLSLSFLFFFTMFMLVFNKYLFLAF